LVPLLISNIGFNMLQLETMSDIEFTMLYYNINRKSAKKKLAYDKQYEQEMKLMNSAYYVGVHSFDGRNK